MSDLPEFLVVVGVLVVGVALWLGLGLPGVIGYIGALLVTIGVVLAWWQGRSRRAGRAG